LQTQNLVPAIYSFDSSLALLGLTYGVDPTFPAFKAAGTITDAGFTWSTSGQYLTRPLALSVTGVFDPNANALDWSGSGSYAGLPWAMDGRTEWPSPDVFAIRDSIAIDGVLAMNSGGVNAPASNTGSLETDDSVTFHIEASKHTIKVGRRTRTVRDRYLVSVDAKGNITNRYRLEAQDDRIEGRTGVTVGGGSGSRVNFAGRTWVKIGVVTPEPATLTLTMLGVGVLAAKRRVGR